MAKVFPLWECTLFPSVSPSRLIPLRSCWKKENVFFKKWVLISRYQTSNKYECNWCGLELRIVIFFLFFNAQGFSKEIFDRSNLDTVSENDTQQPQTKELELIFVHMCNIGISPAIKHCDRYRYSPRHSQRVKLLSPTESYVRGRGYAKISTKMRAIVTNRCEERVLRRDTPWYGVR